MTRITAAAPGMTSATSLTRRFGLKLLFQVISVPISVALQSLLARMAGPVNLGRYAYLQNFFSQLVGLLEGGTTGFLCARVTQKPEDREALFVFWFGVVTATLVLSLLVLLAFVVSADAAVWPGENVVLVLMGLALGILSWGNQALQRLMDAHAFTVSAEIVKGAHKIVQVGVAAALFAWAGGLSTYGLLLFQICSLALLFLVIVQQLWIKKIPIFGSRPQRFGEVVHQFWIFNSPLLVYSLVGFVTVVFDRWLLQHVGGAREQGYLAFGTQVGLIATLVISSLSPLLLREFALTSGAERSDERNRLYRRSSEMLFSIVTALSVFLALESSAITRLLGGSEFLDAQTIVFLCALYPVYQTFGQVNGSLLFAAGATRLYRNCGVLSMAAGVPLSLLLVLPHSAGGLEWGGFGVALKLHAVQLFGVALQLYYMRELTGISLSEHLIRQARVLGAYGVVALLSFFSGYLSGTSGWEGEVVIGLIYLIMCLAVMNRYPRIVGLPADVGAQLKGLFRAGR